jgi:predicted aspartyl protease
MKVLATVAFGCLLVLPCSGDDFEVPFEVHGRQHAILVDVRVNGEDRVFLVDTGAARTVVSAATAGVSRFELRRARFSGRGPGLGGHGLSAKVASVRLGESRWYDRRVLVMNLEKLSEVYGCPIDGLLGQDILREFERVVIDFKKRRLLLTR